MSVLTDLIIKALSDRNISEVARRTHIPQAKIYHIVNNPRVAPDRLHSKVLMEYLGINTMQRRGGIQASYTLPPVLAKRLYVAADSKGLTVNKFFLDALSAAVESVEGEY